MQSAVPLWSDVAKKGANGGRQINPGQSAAYRLVQKPVMRTTNATLGAQKKDITVKFPAVQRPTGSPSKQKATTVVDPKQTQLPRPKTPEPPEITSKTPLALAHGRARARIPAVALTPPRDGGKASLDNPREWPLFGTQELTPPSTPNRPCEAVQHAKTVIPRPRKPAESQFFLPVELFLPIVLQLNARDRHNLAAACRDARMLMLSTVATWNRSAGDFNDAEKRSGPGPKLIKPSTKHAVTIIREAVVEPGEDPYNAYHRGIQKSLFRRMTLALSNMRHEIRHLEFHDTPVLNMDLLNLLVPEMSNLEYLGIFRCWHISLPHLDSLFCLIGAENGEGKIQLDFYPPKDDYQVEKEVNTSVGLVAFLYHTLPSRAARRARLLAPGCAFRAFVKKQNRWAFENLDRIQKNVQDRFVISRFMRTTGFNLNSNDARMWECGGIDGEVEGYPMCGGFFPKAQFKVDCPECFGCKLVSQLVYRTQFGDKMLWAEAMFECLMKKTELDPYPWLQDLQSFLDSARKDEMDKEDDMSFHQYDSERLERAHREKLIKSGKIRPDQTRIPGRYNWARVRRS